MLFDGADRCFIIPKKRTDIMLFDGANMTFVIPKERDTPILIDGTSYNCDYSRRFKKGIW